MDFTVRLSQHILVVFVSCVVAAVAITRPTAITINNNGYENVLVAIHPDVAQSTQIIDNVKAMFTEASAYIYTATEKRAYFKDVTILIPYTWTPDPAWGPATSQLYNNADVVVQNPLVTHRKRRSTDTETDGQTDTQGRVGGYTRSYGGCGQPGVRINIFTDLFGSRGKIQYGPAGRLLVHEWAHFRWGVFDEYAEEGEPQFYFSPFTGQLEATRCNINMVGRIYKKDPVTGRATLCQMVDPRTGMYDDECIFNPYTIGHFNDNITASIMDRQNVPTITQFCNDDPTDKMRIHNYESPSRHNRLCGSRSTWTVIKESVDFHGGRNPPRDIPDTTPTFKVVRLATARRMVLAIDSSASMKSDEKLIKARQAATTFVEDALDDEVSLGVVSFDSEAKIISPLTQLANATSRKNVANKLPCKAAGETSVGAAVLKSVEVLQDDEENATDAFIVVITDGQDTSSPSIDDVIDRVKEAGAVVTVIALDYDTDRSLERLTRETGGRYYFDTNDEKSTTAVDAMLDVYRLFDCGVRQLPVQILSQSKILSHHESLSGSFLMDSSLGRNTRVIITYTSDQAPNVTLTSPTGRKYCYLYPEYSHDPTLKRIKITIPSLAETGHWTYAITNNDVESKRMSIMVLSTGINPQAPTLQLTGDLVVDASGWPIKTTLIAEVTRGTSPVKDLKVKATISRPLASPHVLELFDSGVGSDAVKNDGVYSRYFTQFSVSGSYTVNIEIVKENENVHAAQGEENEAFHMATAYAGTFNINHPKLPSRDHFHHGQTPWSLVDEYPPTRITDLRVLHTSRDNGTVVLAWTAPGDDGDFNRASFYTVVMTPTADAIVNNSQDLPEVDKKFVVGGDLSSPKPFGEKEEIKLKMDVPRHANVSMVFSVFAVDESGNKGELSNLVTVGLGFVPDISTEEYLLEGKGAAETDKKDPPSGQKVVIATVVGTAAALLAVTVIVSVIVHFTIVQRNKREEQKRFLQEKCIIV